MISLCQLSFLSVSLFLLYNVARLGVLVVFFDLLCDLCKVVEKLKKSTDSVFSGLFLTGRGCGRPPPRLPETPRRSPKVPETHPSKGPNPPKVPEGPRSFSRSFCTFRLSQKIEISQSPEGPRRSPKVPEGPRNFLALQALFFMFLFVFVPEGAAWEHFAACVPFLIAQCRTQQFFRILSIPYQI
jgi:hypothetical protein